MRRLPAARLLIPSAFVVTLMLGAGGPSWSPDAQAQSQAPAGPAMTPDEIAACLCQKELLDHQQSNVDVQGGLLQERQQELTNLDAQIKAQAARTPSTDVVGQQVLQNLIAQDVDAILVNPGDVSGLNATLQEALDAGIIVISVDQELDVPGVYNVGIDQKEWAKTSAQWLAEKLGGEGDIVQIEGFPGHPANLARMEGVAEVFAEHPGINVLATDTGRWDEATVQQVMSNFLASYPNLDGYWTQDGMEIGALQAVMAANPAEWPQGVGEGRCQYLRLWEDALALNPDFDSIAVANHPGVSPTGLRIAVNMLQGKQVDESKLGGANGLSFVLPVAAVITSENLDEGLAMCEGKPDAYLLDDILTDEEVVSEYFQ